MSALRMNRTDRAKYAFNDPKYPKCHLVNQEGACFTVIPINKATPQKLYKKKVIKRPNWFIRNLQKLCSFAKNKYIAYKIRRRAMKAFLKPNIMTLEDILNSPSISK